MDNKKNCGKYYKKYGKNKIKSNLVRNKVMIHQIKQDT